MSGHVNYVMMSAGDVGDGSIMFLISGGGGGRGGYEGERGGDVRLLRDTGILPVKKEEEENINGTGEIYLTLLLRSGLGSA